MKIDVTKSDIRAGIAGDCHSCPVALAIARATGDREPSISERDWELRIETNCRTIPAPYEVRHFIREFDALPRIVRGTKRGRIRRGTKLPEPFSFELPPFDDPEWQEECYKCEQLFQPEELDDEGYCPECVKRRSVRRQEVASS